MLSKFDLILDVLANASKTTQAYRKVCGSNIAAEFFKNQETRELQAALQDLENSIIKIYDILAKRF